MSLFILLPNGHGLRELLYLLGEADKLSGGDAEEVIRSFREVAGGPLARFPEWTLWEIPVPDPDRIKMLTAAIRESLTENGAAALDLEARMVTVAELVTLAAGLELDLNLEACLNRRADGTRSRSPLIDPLDNAIVSALRQFGGSATSLQIAKQLNVKRAKILRHLSVLVGFERIARHGSGSAVRYSLIGEEE